MSPEEIFSQKQAGQLGPGTTEGSNWLLIREGSCYRDPNVGFDLLNEKANGKVLSWCYDHFCCVEAVAFPLFSDWRT